MDATTAPAPRSGSLLPPGAAPPAGERTETVLALGPLLIEQILSGPSNGRHDYLQDSDEWVVVLAGAAVMEVAGEALELGPGDWAFLPAGVPHAVVATAAGTSWLAVHRSPTA